MQKRAININIKFAKYVAQDICGMLGVSLYILADTFFISKAAGADGITILNLALPVYNFMYAFGSMLGLGAATRFAILKEEADSEADSFFSTAIVFGVIIGLVFTLAGLVSPQSIIRLMGGEGELVDFGAEYFRWMLLFGPAFVLNFVFSAFVRNDDDPTLAMVATLASSIFNIIFDYVFMFPLDMGISGAALATAISPIVAILINSSHFLKKKNNIKLLPEGWSSVSFDKLVRACQLGVTGFMGEMSLGITNTVFNYLILGLTGNIGVASYGIVANYSLVLMSMFNGLAQGSQPVISESYASDDRESLGKLFRLGIIYAVAMAAAAYIVIFAFTDKLIQIFNGEGNETLIKYAREGMRLYFLGYLFAGVNIYCAGFFGATNSPGQATFISLMRGFVVIILCSLALAGLFGMTGVWLAFPAAEIITFLIMVVSMAKKSKAG